jgi:hypothetical protein
MRLASSDQLSLCPAGVVKSVRTGSREVRAGVREARRQRPPGLPMATIFAAARSNSSRQGGG